MDEKYLQLAFDKKGNLVSIYEVSTGILCACFCPKCKLPLIAKNNGKTADTILSGGRKVAHFAHQQESNCDGSNESAIHLLAKKILQEEKKLLIPELMKNGLKLTEAQILKFDSVDIEKSFFVEDSRIQPDVICYKGDKRLLVEICHTHTVDSSKLKKIKRLNISCLEIDIQSISYLKQGEALTAEMRDLIQSSNKNRVWLHSTETEKLYDKKLLKIQKALEMERKEAAEANKILPKRHRRIKVFEVDPDGEYGQNSRYQHLKAVEGEYFLRYVYCPLAKFEKREKRVSLSDCHECKYQRGTRIRCYKSILCGYVEG